MLYSPEEVERRAAQYAQQHHIQLEVRLGFGSDGIVWSTNRQSAAKVHGRETSFLRERDAYLRLGEFGVTEIHGFTVPPLLEHDDGLWIIELEIVEPPFVLDFGKSYLDEVPEFSPETLAEVEAENHERFGERWPVVRRILRTLEGYGVYHVDVSPNNIRFADEG